MSTRWGYGGPVEIDPRPGGTYRNLTTEDMRQMGMGDVAVEGEVVEIDPPHRLVITWKPSWHPDSQPTRLTWELTEYSGGLTYVTLTHDLTAPRSMRRRSAASSATPSRGVAAGRGPSPASRPCWRRASRWTPPDRGPFEVCRTRLVGPTVPVLRSRCQDAAIAGP